MPAAAGMTQFFDGECGSLFFKKETKTHRHPGLDPGARAKQNGL